MLFTKDSPFLASRHPLSELNFMDIYVRLDSDDIPHYRSGIGSTIDLPDADVPKEYLSDVAALAEHLSEHFEGTESAITYGGMRLRATRLETANGEVWAALRRLPNRPLPLEQLGFVPQLLPVLEEMGKRSGLILISGASGQGKTTTISSLLLRYLEIYGGVSFTLEDPVEYDMEGRCGKSGYCYQAEIKHEREWGEMLKRALRWHPRYITVGEIRTSGAANQVLRAATSGHTVLATMHEQDLGTRAPMLLAAGLTGVMYQAFTRGGLHAQFMMTEADNPGSALRALIRGRRIGQTRTIADQQMAKLIQNGRVF